jgi:hypothetical protein
VRYFLLAVLVMVPGMARAGAWTLGRQHWQVISGGVASDAATGFDSAGHADVPLHFEKAALQSSTEYGLLDSVTLFLNTETVSARSRAPGVLPVSALDNAVEGGVRVRLTQDIGVLSLQASYKTAGAFDFSVSANGNASGRGAQIRALYGTNFQWLGYDGFLDIEAGERFLSAPRPSETPVDLTLGLHLTGGTMVMVQNFNIIGGSNGRPPYAYFRSHKIELSLVQRMSRHFWIQLGGFVSPLGQNALREQGLALAHWTKI